MGILYNIEVNKALEGKKVKHVHFIGNNAILLVLDDNTAILCLPEMRDSPKISYFYSTLEKLQEEFPNLLREDASATQDKKDKLN